MASPTNKGFLPVGGKSILGRTLETFEQDPIVDTVVLVCADADRAACAMIVDGAGLHKVRRIVTGGASRHESEFQGLLALEDEIADGTIETVLVHDAVRPFATPDRIEAVTAEAQRTGAAILAIPANERIVSADESGEVVDGEDNLWVAQTPQAFDAKLVLDAHRRAAEEGFVGTDTSAVVERAGHPVSVVAGHARNIKITTSDDLLRAELIAEQLSGRADAVSLGALTPRV
jgi:2-C-methyl-D-erythritol 4-phosphate cytidylyltransferase